MGIKKAQLENEYIAYGRFYTLKYENGEKRLCRSLLEIFERKSIDSLKDTNKIDAVFIMMNPGSGKPMKIYTQQCKSISQIKTGELDKIQLVETDPDDTQYQVMRVMKKKAWKYVRIINLSDYRNPQSKSFYSMIRESVPYDNEFIHSIFSKERSQEINNIFIASDKFKLITAWGVNTKLHKLIKLALQNNKLIERVGYNKATYKRRKQFYYYHPLPRNSSKQILWLDEIIRKL
ncbi:DUF1643 domain-containing protein [Clostridium estertheticum]|uniref:DUF1643 domain-containing protein n=1 Tax=Clostridium estertheticum TaxID=238834 RepID=UPI001C0DAD5E|nr:DUF1643 domain-containing protein [Clostridium estertheticum]MBU3075593.1 DUF1643 domain-containing protein [Clostridium estertheticum]MBU3164825.1 DUF1643 domain-containing protein [Clostridium estertheticum]